MVRCPPPPPCTLTPAPSCRPPAAPRVGPGIIHSGLGSPKNTGRRRGGRPQCPRSGAPAAAASAGAGTGGPPAGRAPAPAQHGGWGEVVGSLQQPRQLEQVAGGRPPAGRAPAPAQQWPWVVQGSLESRPRAAHDPPPRPVPRVRAPPHLPHPQRQGHQQQQPVPAACAAPGVCRRQRSGRGRVCGGPRRRLLLRCRAAGARC
jgi:hypothetical protein